MLKSKNRKVFFIVSGLLIICFILFFLVKKDESNNLLEVIYLDIGQGDSILIKTPSHHTILIDGGPDNSVVSKVGNYLPFYQQEIDLIILTHAHEDHIAGLIGIINKYEVGKIIYSQVEYSSSSYIEWQSILVTKNTEVIEPIAGQEFIFNEVNLEILYPSNKFEITPEDLNETSIVARLTYQDTSFLFTGDAPVVVERSLMQNKGDKLKSDVLKVGHHGSKYSSSLDFLEAVRPEYAIIQSGVDNKFGHPHKLTLNKLNGLGIEILRNDEMGDITILSNGKDVWVE